MNRRLRFRHAAKPPQDISIDPVGCIVDTKIHRDRPAVGEPVQQLIDRKHEHDAADEAVFVIHGTEEDITRRVEGREKSHRRRRDHALFIACLFEGCLA